MVSTTDGTIVGRVNPTELEFISGYTLDTASGDLTIQANSGAGAVNIIGFAGGVTFKGGTITGTTTLTAADSGTTYILTQPSGAYTIQMPTTAAGLVFRFVLRVVLTNNLGLEFIAPHLYGSYDLGGTPAQVNVQQTMSFTGDDAQIGDTLEFYGIDSTHWYVTGRTTNTNGIFISPNPFP